jgi:hypothetical protein
MHMNEIPVDRDRDLPEMFNYWANHIGGLKSLGCALPDDFELGKKYRECMASRDPKAAMQKLFAEWNTSPQTSGQANRRLRAAMSSGGHHIFSATFDGGQNPDATGDMGEMTMNFFTKVESLRKDGRDLPAFDEVRRKFGECFRNPDPPLAVKVLLDEFASMPRAGARGGNRFAGNTDLSASAEARYLQTAASSNGHRAQNFSADDASLGTLVARAIEDSQNF